MCPKQLGETFKVVKNESRKITYILTAKNLQSYLKALVLWYALSMIHFEQSSNQKR